MNPTNGSLNPLSVIRDNLARHILTVLAWFVMVWIVIVATTPGALRVLLVGATIITGLVYQWALARIDQRRARDDVFGDGDR